MGQIITESEQLLLLKQEMENHKQIAEEQINRLQEQVSGLDVRVKEMEMSKQKTEYQYEQIMQSLKTLNEKTIPNLTAQIQDLKDKPVKRYDQAISGVIGAIFGSIGTSIVNLLIKK